MSQLIDKLNRVAKTAPAQPMGFRTVQPDEAKAHMLLVASLAQFESLTSLGGCIAGADAVLVPIIKANLEAKAIQKVTRLDIPWGGWLKDIDEKDVGTIVEAGGDFVVFPASCAISAIPRDDNAGKVLQVEPSLNEGLLRAINELPVDAVLIAGEAKSQDSLAWHDLMLFQRAATLLSKPLLVSIPPQVSADELKALWDIGVDGVVIEVSKELPEGRLRELRRAAGDLTSSPKRRRGRAEARLPSIKMGTPAEPDEEEEDE